MPLLLAFIRAHFDITVLLDDPRFTSDEVIAFLSDPATQARVADIAKLAHLGLTIRAAEARHVAIDALEHVVKTSTDLVEKRRAATALFRATASPLIPLASSTRTRTSSASHATGCDVGGPASAKHRSVRDVLLDADSSGVASVIAEQARPAPLKSDHSCSRAGMPPECARADLAPALAISAQWPSVALSGESSSSRPSRSNSTSPPPRNSAPSEASAFSPPSRPRRSADLIRAMGLVDTT